MAESILDKKLCSVDATSRRSWIVRLSIKLVAYNSGQSSNQSMNQVGFILRPHAKILAFTATATPSKEKIAAKLVMNMRYT